MPDVPGPGRCLRRGPVPAARRRRRQPGVLAREHRRGAAMALCGARGQTAAEIAAALGLPGPQAAAEGLRLLSRGPGGRAGSGRHPPRAEHDVGAVGPAAGARVHRGAARGRRRQRPRRRFHPCRRRGPAGDQRPDRQADRGQGHWPASSWRHRCPDPAGAGQRDLPEGCLGFPVPRARDRRCAVLPRRPGRRHPGDRAHDAADREPPVPARRRVSGGAAALPRRRAGHDDRAAGRAAGPAAGRSRRPARRPDPAGHAPPGDARAAQVPAGGGIPA